MKQMCLKKRLNKFVTLIGAFLIGVLLVNGSVNAGEVVIGEESINGEIALIFEAAPADTVSPSFMHLPEDETEVHLEVKANFEDNNRYASSEGGFVPYLNVNAFIKNRATGEALQITLTPHLNLVDSFHYARNIDLPGDPVNDSYDLTFFVDPAGLFQVQIHADFRINLGGSIIESQEFTFENVNFAEVFNGA